METESQRRNHHPVIPALLACLWLLSGCLVIPIPKEHQFFGGRRTITEEEVARLVVGTTTRADVVLTFGEPDVASVDGRQFAYSWSMEKAVYLLFLPASPYSGVVLGGEIAKRHLVFLQFDEQGLLERIELSDDYGGNLANKLDEMGMEYDHRHASPSEATKKIILSPCEPDPAGADPASGQNLRIQVVKFKDIRPDTDGDPHRMGEARSLGLLVGNAFCKEPVADLVERVVSAQLHVDEAGTAADCPDYVLSATILAFAIRTEFSLLKMNPWRAMLDADIEFLLIPADPQQQGLNWRYTNTCTIRLMSPNMRPAMDELLCDSVKALQASIASQLEGFPAAASRASDGNAAGIVQEALEPLDP